MASLKQYIFIPYLSKIFKSNYMQKAIGAFVGVLFIFSSISKAIDIDSFTFILMSFGNKKFAFLAPFITSIEFFIGLCYILKVCLNRVVKISFWFTLILTVTFLLGHIFMGIEDCGCFGNVIKFNPKFILVKNFILLILIYFFQKQYSFNNKGFLRLYVSVLFSLTLFAVNIYEVYKFNIQNNISIGQNFNVPKNFIKNGNQIWFLFNPYCLHCKNLAKKLIISKEPIIGIYSDRIDSLDIRRFSEDLKINFSLVGINDSLMNKITYRYPLIIKTKNGIVNSVITDL